MSTLENKIIISTRPLSVNDSIKNRLTERGAIVLDFPMIKICAVDLTGEIKDRLQQIATYQWIVFTSKNGVDYFFQMLNRLNIKTDELSSIKIAVVGKMTSEEVLKNNCRPHLISSGNTSADLLKELVEKIKPSEKVLLALGELAEDTFEKGLVNSGKITRINVYKTVQPDMISTEIIERIKKDNYHIILFTSPSGVQYFNKIMSDNKIIVDFRTACIGVTTEKAMLKNNCKPLFVSQRSNGETFVNELERFFNNTKN
ncbi:MAG: uroporphyrinogen-III synthase [Paludibacter sp.]|nr:uroporphyrinogen-III synthase [Paludibacter sp.]